MAAPTTTASEKYQPKQQYNINQFTSGVSKYTQEKTCAEVSFS